MPYEWEDWALRALAAGIEPYEVRQVLEYPHRWPRPASGSRVLTIWGRTSAGRPLLVAVYHVDGFTWKIIGARELTTAEQNDLAAWEKTR